MQALEALLARGASALAADRRAELGYGLFASGDPQFDSADYAPWIAQRHGEPYVARMRAKMGENVWFATGAMIQALGCSNELEPLIRQADDRCHIYVGSGVGDLPQSYAAVRTLDAATRAWNHFWGASAARPHGASSLADQPAAPPAAGSGDALAQNGPPPNPESLPVDSEERYQAVGAWDAYWAERSPALRDFLARYAEVERMTADDEERDQAHLHAIRKRMRAHQALLQEYGCPPPPWTQVSSKLIWNIQNSPAAQISMLLNVHGAAWAPVGACSTFGVALKCGRDAILRGEALLAITGTTDPRPDPALVSAFHEARVLPGTGEVNFPFTTLRGTHISGGACMWVLGDAEWCEARGLRPLVYVDAVELASDAEHIITPSKSGPKRAVARAYEAAGISAEDVAVLDLHATGTPGDLNELQLLEEFRGPATRVTARKGQLGHGMANAGGWELTALALSLRRGEALPIGVDPATIHPAIRQPGAIVTGAAPLPSGVGVKLMLGIGGLTACVVLRRAEASGFTGAPQ